MKILLILVWMNMVWNRQMIAATGLAQQAKYSYFLYQNHNIYVFPVRNGSILNISFYNQTDQNITFTFNSDIGQHHITALSYYSLNNLLVVGQSGWKVIVYRINLTEPFEFQKYLQYKTSTYINIVGMQNQVIYAGQDSGYIEYYYDGKQTQKCKNDIINSIKVNIINESHIDLFIGGRQGYYTILQINNFNINIIQTIKNGSTLKHLYFNISNNTQIHIISYTSSTISILYENYQANTTQQTIIYSKNQQIYDIISTQIYNKIKQSNQQCNNTIYCQQLCNNTIDCNDSCIECQCRCYDEYKGQLYIIISGNKVFETAQINYFIDYNGTAYFSIKWIICQIVDYQMKYLSLQYFNISQNINVTVIFMDNNDIFRSNFSSDNTSIQYTYTDTQGTKICSNKCSQCQSQTECTVCTPNFYLNTSNISECLQCQIQNCIECKNDSCIKCDVNYFYINNKCQQCSQVIKKCTHCQSSTQCKICNNNAFLHSDKTCHSCTQVTQNCAVCKNQQNCSICKFGYYYYEYTSCQPCGWMCRNCFLKQDLCLSCYQNFTLINFDCVCQQPFVFVNKQCFKCPFQCKQCSQRQKCQVCNNGFQLTNQICVQIPPEQPQQPQKPQQPKQPQQTKNQTIINFSQYKFFVTISSQYNPIVSQIFFRLRFSRQYILKNEINNLLNITNDNKLISIKSIKTLSQTQIQVIIDVKQSIENPYFIVSFQPGGITNIENDNLTNSTIPVNLGLILKISKEQAAILNLFKSNSQGMVTATRYGFAIMLFVGGLEFVIGLLGFIQIMALYALMSIRIPQNLMVLLKAFMSFQVNGLTPISIEPLQLQDNRILQSPYAQYGLTLNFYNLNQTDIIFFIGGILYATLLYKLNPTILPHKLYNSYRDKYFNHYKQNIFLQFYSVYYIFIISTQLNLRFLKFTTLQQLINLFLSLYIYGFGIILPIVFIFYFYSLQPQYFHSYYQNTNLNSYSAFYIAIKNIRYFYMPALIIIVPYYVIVGTLIIIQSLLIFIAIKGKIYEYKCRLVKQLFQQFLFLVFNIGILLLGLIGNIMSKELFWLSGYFLLGICISIGLLQVIQIIIESALIIKNIATYIYMNCCKQKVELNLKKNQDDNIQNANAQSIITFKKKQDKKYSLSSHVIQSPAQLSSNSIVTQRLCRRNAILKQNQETH